MGILPGLAPHNVCIAAKYLNCSRAEVGIIEIVIESYESVYETLVSFSSVRDGEKYQQFVEFDSD